MSAVIAEANALADTHFDSEITRSEAFESLRETVDEDAAGADELLFDLALIEARAHERARAGRPLAGEPADVVLTAWARVVGGAPVESRAEATRSAANSLAESLADKELDGSPEVAAAAWSALAIFALRHESEPLATAALRCARRALAGVRGMDAAQSATLWIELGSFADAPDAVMDAADRLWSLRESDELDASERFDALVPVWQARMAMGAPDAAEEAARALLEVARVLDRPARVAEALGAVAECALARGDVRGARAALRRRVELCEALIDESRDEGEREFAAARRDEARAALDELDAADA